MSDYLNLTGPQFGGLGASSAQPGLNLSQAGGVTAQTPTGGADVAPAAHQEMAQEVKVEGNLTGLLGTSLDQISSDSVPLSRDVLALNSPSSGANVAQTGTSSPVAASPQSLETLGQWESPVDLDPTTMGKVDLSGTQVASRTEIDQPTVQGDRVSYQNTYSGVSDVLNLKDPVGVDAALGNVNNVALSTAAPVASETKRLDKLVAMMASGTDISKMDSAQLGEVQSVVGKEQIGEVSDSTYGNLGSLGVNPTLRGSAGDPMGPLDDYMNGNASQA